MVHGNHPRQKLHKPRCKWQLFRGNLTRTQKDRTSLGHCYDHSHRNDPKERDRVPVGESETAVRFSAPHLLRLRCSVDSVTGQIKADPRQSYRIVRPRGNQQFPAKRLTFL